MEENIHYIYSKRCIACLGETSEMHILTEKFDDCLDLAGVLKVCLHCEIDKPYFPTMLCDHCISVLKEFFKFKMRFLNNEVILRNNFGIKREDLSDNECFDYTDEPDFDSVVLKAELKTDIESDEEEIIFEVVGEDFKENIMNDPQEEIESKDFVNDDKYTISQIIIGQENEEVDHEEEISNYHHDFLHEEANISERPTNFRCSVCKTFFVDSMSLDAHLFKHKKHKCDICKQIFIKKSYLTDHMVTHKSTKDIACLICPKAFKSRQTMRAHMRIHTHPGSFVCESCGRCFNHRGTLKTHIRLKHSQNRDYLCLWCGMKFNLKASLDKHALRKHSSKKTRATYRCADCNVEYLDKSTLERHRRTKHSPNYKLIPCELCHKVFSDKSNLLRHKRTKHSKEIVEVKSDDSWGPKVKVEKYILNE